MKKLYSLFIGIDTYHPDSKITPLDGCRNDVTAMKDFLSNTYAKAFDLAPSLTLLNQDATYQNICKSLGPDHLSKAGKDDVVLLYYSGHGTQEKAAPEFEWLDPTGVQEAMVCYDSGLKDKFCLSDKEIRVLLQQVQQQGAHVLTIFDCCHSGTMTRAIDDVNHGKSRQFFFPERTEARPYASYLNGFFVKNFPQGPRSNQLPMATHLMMSACDRQEKAFELKNQRGMFSFNLLNVLANDPDVSYADLYTRCQASMFRSAEKQHPQFEPIAGFDPYQKFLNLGSAKDLAQRRVYLLSANDKNAWNINCGAIHGLSTELNKIADFEIVDRKTGKALGRATTSSVGFQDSTVVLADNLALDMNGSYDARLLSLPNTPYAIALKTTGKGKKRYQAYIGAQKSMGRPQLSPYFELVEGKVGGKYRLDLDQDVLTIFNQESNTLIKQIGGDDDDKVFELAVDILNGIAKWEQNLLLDNRSTQFNRNAFQITAKNSDTGQILTKGIIDPANTNTEVVNVQLGKNLNGKYILPLDLELKNATAGTLFCKALYFSGKYGVVSLNGDYLTADEIPAQDQFLQPQFLEFEVPNGKKESIEIVKFIISTTKVNEDFLLEKDDLEGLGETTEFWKASNKGVGELANTRELVKKGQEKKAPENDWFSKTIIFKISVQAGEITKTETKLAGGKITIKGHDTFRANVSLSAVGSSTRDLNSVASLPQILGWNNLLSLEYSSRDLSGGSADTLELNDLQNDADLEKNPLIIELDEQLKDGEFILPLTFDGEDFIPVGDAQSNTAGKVEIAIHSIPDVKAESKSVFRALKLCFFKVVMGRENLNKLCWIEYKDGKPIYHDTGVKEKVSAAKNILMVIHGIIGNTQEMAMGMERALRDKTVDLVLAYDYENLNSTIDANARKLKEALEAVGIQAARRGMLRKKFTILAHSMGGLVSRCYIEQLGGNTVVTKLILAGTPNGGSNLSNLVKYRDNALLLLPLAVNIGLAIPAIASIMGILKGSKSLTTSLEQMNFESKGHFLKNLELSKDPGIPYYVIAGHLDQFLETDNQAKRLVNKLFKNVASLFYTEPNDIAVGVNSIKRVPVKRKPAPVFFDVNCHHLNYFTVGDSVNKILELLKK